MLDLNIQILEMHAQLQYNTHRVHDVWKHRMSVFSHFYFTNKSLNYIIFQSLSKYFVGFNQLSSSGLFSRYSALLVVQRRLFSVFTMYFQIKHDGHNNEAASDDSHVEEMLPYHHVASPVAHHDLWELSVGPVTAFPAKCHEVLLKRKQISEFVSRCFADVPAASHRSPACSSMSRFLCGLLWGCSHLSKACWHHWYNSHHFFRKCHAVLEECVAATAVCVCVCVVEQMLPIRPRLCC